jgi:AraC-like DNA-binding protein
MKKQINPHRGSDFDDFLKEEGIFEEVSANAAMRVIVEQIRAEMVRRKITEAELARRMETSRSQVHRLLSSEQKSATVETLARAAGAVGKRLNVKLVAA